MHETSLQLRGQHLQPLWAQVRINELSSVVDYFVIVESAMTFTGRQQELHFAQTKHLLQQFSEQIIHVVLHHLEGHSTWEREAYHRRQLFAVGLHQPGKEVQPEDIVISSDLDEIPRPKVLMALKACTGYPRGMALVCPIAYYSFGMEGASWTKAKVSVWTEGLDAEGVRMRAEDHSIAKGCWHCSYCFPRIADVIRKIESFSHAEYDRMTFKNPAHIVEVTKGGLDIFDRELLSTEATECDAPDYVRTTPGLNYMLDRSGVAAGYKDYQDYFAS